MTKSTASEPIAFEPTAQPLAASTTLADLPLRDELRSEEAYGAPQLDVDVRLNTNENPYAPSEALVADLVEEIGTQARTLNRYPERDNVELSTALAE